MANTKETTAREILISASIQTALNLKTPISSQAAAAAAARASNGCLLFTTRNKDPNQSCWPSIVIVTTPLPGLDHLFFSPRYITLIIAVGVHVGGLTRVLNNQRLMGASVGV